MVIWFMTLDVPYIAKSTLDWILIIFLSKFFKVGKVILSFLVFHLPFAIFFKWIWVILKENLTNLENQNYDIQKNPS